MRLGGIPSFTLSELLHLKVRYMRYFSCPVNELEPYKHITAQLSIHEQIEDNLSKK